MFGESAAIRHFSAHLRMERSETLVIKILFVCHGNICRSPMAEFVMQKLVNEAGLSDQFHIASAATSREEIGNDVHYGTKQKMAEMGVPIWRREARQMTKQDYLSYEFDG